MRESAGTTLTGWSVLLVAATAGPAQALAAAAVGAALAGHPVGYWCAALGLATVLRALGSYGAHLLAARAAARLGDALHRRFATALIAGSAQRHGDLAAAVAGSLQAVRGRYEVAGLALGSALILLALDLRLFALWLVAAVVVVLLMRRDRGARMLVCARRLVAAGEDRRHALLAAAPLLADLRLVGAAVQRDHHAENLPQRAASSAAEAIRQPAMQAQLVAGLAQTTIAVWAVLLVGERTLGIAGAIAAILATTTAAARCELLAGASLGEATWRLALRRLTRLPAPPAAVSPATGAASLAVGVGEPLCVPAAGCLAIVGPPQRLDAVLAALRGDGCLSVLLEREGRLVTAASDRPAWAAQVAVVGAEDRLFAGTVRRNLDPAGRHAPAELLAALSQAGFAEAASRLDQELGADGHGVSAGETMRLALARAILARPGVLVIADPTRALDRATAARLHALIAGASRPWTLLIVGADAATVAACGRLAVLDPAGLRCGDAGELLRQDEVRCWLRGEAA